MKQSFVDYVATHTKGGRDRLLYPGKEASSRAERRKERRKTKRQRVSLPCAVLPCEELQGVALPCVELPCEELQGVTLP